MSAEINKQIAKEASTDAWFPPPDMISIMMSLISLGENNNNTINPDE